MGVRWNLRVVVFLNYKSKKEAFDGILQITSNIIDNKLENLVRKGEFVYDE